jgi:hypothetical protein
MTRPHPLAVEKGLEGGGGMPGVHIRFSMVLFGYRGRRKFLPNP